MVGLRDCVIQMGVIQILMAIWCGLVHASLAARYASGRLVVSLWLLRPCR